MAIVKSIENEYKAKFDYHKVSDIHILVTDNDIQLRIIVDSYVNKEARKQGARAVQTENIIQHADFAVKPFYELLKAKFGMFQDGEDDYDDAWKTAEDTPPLFTQQTPDGELIGQWTEEPENEEAAGEETEAAAEVAPDESEAVEPEPIEEAAPEEEVIEEAEVTPEVSGATNEGVTTIATPKEMEEE